MKVESAFPIVVSRDLTGLLAFYTDVLGGEVVYQFPPEGAPAYVSLKLGESSLGLGQDPAYERAAGVPAISLWLYVDDCDAAVEQVRAADGRVVQEASDQPWGEREARVEDPDGNLLIFGRHAAAK